jgi:hypothetical protein
MSTKKKGTLAAPVEWAKHLRPYRKRQQWKKERAAAKKQVRKHK